MASAQPNPAPRGDQAADDRRRAIITAAARMFQERGYSGTTVRDLGREVGITSGAIFHHFGTKEEILLRVVENGVHEATLRMRVSETDSSDPAQRLQSMIQAHLDALLGGSPETLSVLFHERWMLSPEARARLIEMRDAYEAIWDRALEDLGPPFDDAAHRKLSRLLLMGSMNWSAQWYRPDGQFDVADISAALFERFVGARPRVVKRRAKPASSK